MLKVLIIDADSNFASLVGRALVKAGHETRIVGDAKYEVVRAKAFEADLVMMSTAVPGVTTPQQIADLKPHVPGRIVVCGDSDNPEEIRAAITAGATDYILKSLTIVEIVDRALQLENKAESENEPAEESSGDEDSESDDYPDITPTAKAQDAQLRAPLRDGKRPIVIVIAHADDEKRAFQKEIIERISSTLHVIEVSTSEQAIAACAGNRTVMVVLDWEIKNVPAKQAIKKIQEAKNGRSIAIFVTYKSHPPEKQRVAMFGGAMAFAGELWDDGSLEGQFRHVLNVVRKRRRKARLAALKAKAS
jgi:DNA-binding NtrC family response regulator